MTDLCWYAVRTKPAQEDRAAAILAQRGVEVYLPLLKKKPRAGRRDFEPLFPGYLFGRLAVPPADGHSDGSWWWCHDPATP
jgi:hypothetical protein